MENLESLDDGKMHKPIATKMTSKERSWGRHAQASRWERRREGKGGEWRAQRCSTRVQVHRAGRSTFARRSRGEQKGQPGPLFSQLNEDAKSGRRGGERDRFCPPPTSLSFPPPLIRVRFFRWQSLENRDCLFLPSPPPLPFRFHAFPAGSELLFAREPRCRPLCLASVCILIVGPLSLLCLALPDMKKERKRGRGKGEKRRDAWSTREISFKAAFQRSW